MKKGFSLVELSIVLVILGLLVGGILAGQSLIRAAELRSVSADLNRFVTAHLAFRDKYLALPGDITNATAFWGKDNVSCTGDTGTTTVPGTCNGNGDRKIHPTGESARSWQHLANAGLIEGTYPGLGALSTAGVMPKSRVSNMAYNLYWTDMYGNGGAASNEPNRFVAGGYDTAAGTTTTAALKPEDMWNIDTKMDDGLPFQGKMIGLSGTSASGTCSNGTAYTLNNSGIACDFTFIAPL